MIDRTALTASDSADEPISARSVFTRLGRNLTWLLGARGVSGVLSLAYLAVAARALGPSGFGIFSLVLALAGTIAGLAQFKSWQAVVRFGALHLAAGRRRKLAELIGFTATVDLASAVIGACVAVTAALLIGPVFGWSIGQARMAACFGAMILLTTGDTASGVLRLSNRFDLLGLTAATAALVRLAGSLTVWTSGYGLAAMLAVWGGAAIVECSLEWILALRLPNMGIALGRQPWRRALHDNAHVWRFMVDISVASTLAALWQQAGTLSVGAIAGPAAAGGYRIAAKIANALVQPAEAATRALYPELSLLIASSEPVLLRRIVMRTTGLAVAVAAVLVAAIIAMGPFLLRLVAGRAFVTAEPFLLLLCVASAIDLAAIGLEPLLGAHGRSGAIARARIVGGVVYLGAVLALVPLLGPAGAALAAIIAAVTLRGAMWIAARPLLLDLPPRATASSVSVRR